MVALGTVAIVGGVVLVWLAIPALVIVVAWRRFGGRLLEALRPVRPIQEAQDEPRPPGGGEVGATDTPV